MGLYTEGGGDGLMYMYSKWYSCIKKILFRMNSYCTCI